MKVFAKKGVQNAPKKTIFRKKEDKTPQIMQKQSIVGPRKLKSVKNNDSNIEQPSKKKLVLYKKSQCMFHFENGTRCNGHASGGSTLCNIHGGSSVIGAQPIPFNELPVSRIAITKFDPAYHPIRYLELSRQGFSDVEIAADFSISISTLRDWASTIQEFSIAFEIGKTMYEAYFLRTGVRNLHNDRFNNSLYKYITMNKLGYSDKVETKSMNTSLHGVLLVPSEMTPEEWERNNIIEDTAKANEQRQIQ